MKSRLQRRKECYFCGSTQNVEKHHIFKGNKCRKAAEREGMWVYLCMYHHRIGSDAVHVNRDVDIRLMQQAQKVYEEDHTRDEFRQNFIKSYL